MRSTRLLSALAACALVTCQFGPVIANGLPFEGGTFKGRIAYSADGNHNDPDDWTASPMALAIFASMGLRDRLVHFDYNSILPQTDVAWERVHRESVIGAVERYGYDPSLFFDCRRNLDQAVASIVRAINASSADNPLYFIIAGPMEVPHKAIQQADPAKRKFVYCISHSRWNDGFASNYQFTLTKRNIIEQGINWVQIQDQNALLAFGKFGRESPPEEFAPYFWLRDSRDPRNRFQWERMVLSTRPDPSDAGMAWFVATGDETCDPEKLKRLLEDRRHPAPAHARMRVRLEAENFRHIEGWTLDARNDRSASHGLSVRLAGASQGTLRTHFAEPYASPRGIYDVEVRYFDQKDARHRLTLRVNGTPAGDAWESAGQGRGWTSRRIDGVEIAIGDELAVDAEGADARLDYVQLNLVTAAGGAPVATNELDDPAAMPGGLIVAGSNPGYLKYNGGRAVFLSGPDDPETFLYLGTLNPDGTRSGGRQEEIIERMARTGVNAFHCQIFRMRRCNIKDEGDDTHCPFIDHDPAKPLNPAVLDQWERWLTQLERAGINVHFEFYNDATDVVLMGWTLDAAGNLHPDEHRFIAGIVERFKHHKNILWGIKESSNKVPRERVAHFKKIAELIARTDNYNHPIVQSFVVTDDPEGDSFAGMATSDDYVGDPHIRVVTWLHIVPHGDDLARQHQEYLQFAQRESGRFVVMKNETFYKRYLVQPPLSRQYMWAAAMAGLHSLEAQHKAERADHEHLLREDGRIAAFMNQTDFHTMKSRNDLAAGSTKWVLANPGQSYIAYTYDYREGMGLRDVSPGIYDFLWFDTASGVQVEQKTVIVSSSTPSWTRPEHLGNELALYVRRSVAVPASSASTGR